MQLGHSVSVHVLGEMVGKFWKGSLEAGSRRKPESQVEADGLYSNGEAFEVLMWETGDQSCFFKKIILAILFEVRSGRKTTGSKSVEEAAS